MNIGESKQLTLDLIVESVVNSAYVPSAKNNDYLLLHNTLANTAQIEIAQVKKIHAKKSITQNPILNQLGEYQGFDIVQHLNEDNINTQATGSMAYYFEVDNTATVYVEELIIGTWNTLALVNCSSPSGGFVAYKGLINPSSVNNEIRIRFSGSYPYNIRNRALFAYTFATANEVPNYTPYVTYTMPSDFMELNKVVFRGDSRVYDNYMAYYWEGRNKLLINYYEVGSFDVYYYKYPSAITQATLDSVEFEVDIEAQPLIPLYVASKVVAEEKPTLAAILFNEYRLKLSQLSDIDVTGNIVIQSVDGW